MAESSEKGSIELLNDFLKRTKVSAMALVAVVTFATVGAVFFEYEQIDTQTKELAKVEGRTNVNKDKSFRIWASSHGGVYVAVDKDTPPNPFLAKIPERDIATPSGKQLTLMNPAYMLRQIMEHHEKLYGVKGRIVGITHYRPETAADEWETDAIRKFEKGAKEKVEFVTIDNKPYLRIIEPFYTQQGCLKCHGSQGYKVGDVRGGIGVIVSMQPYIDIKNQQLKSMLLTHGIAWFLVIGLIYGGYRQNLKAAQKQIEQEALTEAAHKQREYVTGLLQIVADVDRQIILTAESEAEMVSAAVKRISRFKTYAGVCIALRSDGNLRVAAIAKAGSLVYEEHISKPMMISCSSNVGQALVQNKYIVKSKDELLPEEKELLASLGISLEHIVSVPLRYKSTFEPIGVMSIYTKNPNGFLKEELSMLEGLSGNIGFAINSIWQRDKNRELELKRVQNYEETIHSFVGMIEQRDSYTAGHTLRVAKYSEMIARQMGITGIDIEKLTQAAVLHDIGKLVTPDSILLKPYRLDQLEFKLIQEHVRAGYDMLSAIDMYKELASIILYHHERYDGGGYPFGVSGDSIPLLSSIMCVADSFDAMTTNRVYKARKQLNEALQELKELAGTQFNPQVVEAALKALQHADIPKESTQLPITELEKERFVYFFNDPLTGVYNASYFRILRTSTEQFATYKLGVAIYLRHFSDFNKKFGWDKGNEVLISFARQLMDEFRDGLIFRVKGDDFLVLLKSEEVSQEKLAALSSHIDIDSGIILQIKQHRFDLGVGDDIEELLNSYK